MDTQIANLYRQIGENIRSARRETETSQAVLAQEIGLKRTSITNIESGEQKVQIHNLYAIARFFNRPLVDFLPPVEIMDDSTEAVIETHGEIIVEEGMVGLTDMEQEKILALLNRAQNQEKDNAENNKDKDS